MNPALAGLGMLALAFGAVTRIRALSRNPSTDELADQFKARMRRFYGDEVDHRMDVILDAYLESMDVDTENATDSELDQAFKWIDGCSKKLRREARVKEDRLREIQQVTRHRNFNPDDVRESLALKCKKHHAQHYGPLDSRDIEMCNHEAEEQLDWFDIGHRNLLDYKKLEKRNCPALIAGLRRRINR